MRDWVALSHDLVCAFFSWTDSAIYDDGLIDAAIGRTMNPSTALTALQVSGAMPDFLRTIFLQK